MIMTYWEALILTLKVIARMIYLQLPGIITIGLILVGVRYATGDKAIWRKIFKRIGEMM